MSKERTFRRALGALLRPFGAVSQLESGETSAGIPDTLFFDAETQKDIFIELKHHHPKKKFELRKTQIAWIRKRIRKGGHVFIFLKYETKACTTTTYALLRLDSEKVLDTLALNQNVLTWSAHSVLEWEKEIQVDELLQELRK